MRIRILDPNWKKMDPDPNPEIFLQFLVDIWPLGSVSVDPHIFADPDPGSQNLADPTDPDPKHWYIFSPHVFFILTVSFLHFSFSLDIQLIIFHPLPLHPVTRNKFNNFYFKTKTNNYVIKLEQFFKI